MVRPIESRAAEDLRQERANRRAWLVSPTATTTEQVLHKSKAAIAGKVQQLAENALLGDRDMLASLW
jgi:hypothetical protein